MSALAAFALTSSVSPPLRGTDHKRHVGPGRHVGGERVVEALRGRSRIGGPLGGPQSFRDRLRVEPPPTTPNLQRVHQLGESALNSLVTQVIECTSGSSTSGAIRWHRGPAVDRIVRSLAPRPPATSRPLRFARRSCGSRSATCVVGSVRWRRGLWTKEGSPGLNVGG